MICLGICSGFNAETGNFAEVEFGQTIVNFRPTEVSTRNLWLAPGFVDIQINGFAGIDFNNPGITVAEIARSLKAILATGVTRCLPTVITGAPEDMLRCLRNLRLAQTALPEGRMIAGFHVEGPHIGPEDGPRGAHPARWVRPPDINEFRRWQDVTEGNIRLITLSPHWPEAPRYIAEIAREGVVVAIGHTGADGERIRAAVDSGATLSTHLGNAAPRMMLKQPNCLWDQLAEDRLSATFIVDRVHLGDAFLRAAVRAKGIERTILITDAAAPAGGPRGRYQLGEQAVDLTPGDRVVLAGTEKLAGSALRMNRAIPNLMSSCGTGLASAIRTATVNPARLIRLNGRMHGLDPGECADIVVFRQDSEALDIQQVYLDGERVI